MKIAVLLCLFALAHARHRRIIAFGSGLGFGPSLGFSGLGYNANLGIGYGSNVIGGGQGYGWQGGPGYYGGYGLGGYGVNSPSYGPISPIVRPGASVSPYSSGFSGNAVYSPAIPLGGSNYGGYGNGYGFGNNW